MSKKIGEMTQKIEKGIGLDRVLKQKDVIKWVTIIQANRQRPRTYNVGEIVRIGLMSQNDSTLP